MTRVRGERGTAVVEFSWLAILLLVPLIYVLLAVFDVQRASYGATAATRAAGRAFVIGPGESGVGESRERAFQAARIAMADQGMDLARDQLAITCSPACLEPGSTVTVVLSTSVPLPLIPDFLGDDRPAVQIKSEHTESYGDYRESKADR